LEGPAFLQLTSLHNTGVRVKSLKQLTDSELKSLHNFVQMGP